MSGSNDLLEALIETLCPVTQKYPEKLDQLLSYCHRILQCTFSMEFKNASDQHLYNTIKKKLLRDDPSGSLSVAFSNSYDRLFEMKFIDHSWEFVYFLYQISLQQTHSHHATRTNSSVLFSPSPSSPSITQYQATSTISVTSSLNNWITFLNQMGYISEDALVNDILLLLGGSLTDSCYMSYDSVHDLYLLDPICKIHQTSRNMIQELCRLSSYSLSIQNHIQTLPPGKIYTAISCWVKSNVLDPYYQCISQLSLNNSSMPITLFSLYRALQSHLDLFQQLRHALILSRSIILNSVNNSTAQVLLTLYENLFYTCRSLFPILQMPYYHMITYWIDQGSLVDPYNEFFIYESNRSIQDNTEDEQRTFTLWKDKFLMDSSRIPYFIDQDTALKIFVLGKSKWFMSLHLGSILENNIDTNLVHTKWSILERYQSDAPRLLTLLRTEKSIMLDQHILAMKRYFLGEQSDFIQDLMDTLHTELSKPASLVFRHHLIGSFDDVLRRHQYGTDMTVRRLDVRLLKATKSDHGWDVFTLDYHIDSPLDNIFTIPVMASYMKIFRLIWKLKRCEYVLSMSWKRLYMLGKSSSTYSSSINQYRSALGLSHSTLNRMQFFISTLLHYILIHVVESSWSRLSTTHSQDLDMYNRAHQHYLNNILSNSFFTNSDQEKGLLAKLACIFQVIHKFDGLQREFCQHFEARSNENEITRAMQELIQCSESFQTFFKHFSSDLFEVSSLSSSAMYSYLYALLTFNNL